MAANFTIRPAKLASMDHELLVDFQDSQISWLSDMGSGEQWGTESIRESNPTAIDKTRSWIERSERDMKWSDSWCRAWVAETTNGIPVAGLVLDSKSPKYVRSFLPEQDESDPFVYLAYLISNRHAGESKKGAGTALISFTRDRLSEIGVKRLCLDCFGGNERKLVKYYETQGFRVIKDFVAGEMNWPGCLMEMRM